MAKPKVADDDKKAQDGDDKSGAGASEPTADLAAIRDLLTELKTDSGSILERLSAASSLESKVDDMLGIIKDNPKSTVAGVVEEFRKLLSGDTGDDDKKTTDEKPRGSVADYVFHALTGGAFDNREG
jgi:hypothetical protein